MNEARRGPVNDGGIEADNETGETLKPMVHSALNRCFGCGAANPSGLHLEFLLATDGSVVCLPVIPEAFESIPGYLHGGIIATLLDEAMSKAVRAQGHSAMTRHLQVDYLRPVPSSAPLRIEGRVLRSKSRSHWTEARILNAQGTILAHAKAVFVVPRPST
jgi:uncharacterized protein (TIGR00369 family)